MKLERLKKWLRPRGHDHILTPRDQTARFELRYGSLIVGHLWLNEGTWHFNYSDAFRAQDDVKPLVDFPDPDRVEPYRSSDLWPFFAVRIPSLEQPAVQRAVREMNLDAHNEVDLLRAFGRRTIANPFVLEAAM